MQTIFPGVEFLRTSSKRDARAELSSWVLKLSNKKGSFSFECSDSDGVPSERETPRLPFPKPTLTLKSLL